MATFTATPANWTNATSDANYRAWGQYISDQLTAVGLLKTADTGQVDWLTATNPGAVNTYNDYEIRVFADALQATAPVYFKIEYGEGSGVDNPALRITFGTGSNGTGSLTGTLSTPTYAACALSAGAITVIGSGANNRFVFNAGVTNGFCFGFERTKDSLGNDTAEGIYFFSCGTSLITATVASTQSVVLLWDPSVGDRYRNAGPGAMAALFPFGTSFIFGAQTGVAPIMPEKPIFMNPILNLVGYLTNDISPGNTFVATMYGVTHQYMALVAVQGLSATAFRGIGNGTEAAAIRYE